MAKKNVLEINFENFEIEMLNEINQGIEGFSEMSFIQRAFFNGLIRYYKPKKIVEVGVSAGGSAAIILNAIKDIDDAKLYSLDYNERYYRNSDYETGFIVGEKFPHLKSKWELYAGAVSSALIDNVGSDIDMVLLDSVHLNPGEILDYLAVLPYLKKNAIVVLHDTQFHTMNQWKGMHNSNTNCMLFSSLSGTKLYPKSENLGLGLPNIGAVILDDDAMSRALDIFCLLTIKWAYLPINKDNNDILILFRKHYSDDLINIYNSCYIQNAIEFSNSNLSNVENSKIENLEIKLQYITSQFGDINNKLYKLINLIAWWIPVRKWRDKFRAKFE